MLNVQEPGSPYQTGNINNFHHHMLYAFDEDPEKDHDEDLDADEDKDSEEENEEEEDDQPEDGEDDHDESDDDGEEPGEDDEDEDDKPVTRKELRELLKNNQKDRNARRRVSQKKADTTRNPKTDDRLTALERADRDRQVLERKREFGYENGLSPAQVNLVFRLTKRPTGKFLKVPHVKAALDAISAQERIRSNTPSNSGRNFRSPSGKKWIELKPEERQASFGDRRRAILANKR